MLGITRKDGQAVVIRTKDEKITIWIRKKNGHFRLFFDAPETVTIYRAELIERMNAEFTKP